MTPQPANPHDHDIHARHTRRVASALAAALTAALVAAPVYALTKSRTDSALREQVLAIEGAHAFDPMGGRPMKEWIVVPKASANRWPDLAEAAVAGK